jgi:hypothetical protein
MFHNFKSTTVGDNVLIEGKCIVTGKIVTMTVPLKGYIDYYRNGKMIQDAFPDLPRVQREYMISGCSPEGWEKLYGNLSEEQ